MDKEIKTIEEALEFLKGKTFYVMAHSGDMRWYNLLCDIMDSRVGLVLQEDECGNVTFELHCSNLYSSTKYTKMHVSFLAKPAFRTAVERMFQISKLLESVK